MMEVWKKFWKPFPLWGERLHKPGSVIERYVVQKFLGVGSYGITYLAEDLSTHQKVVLKQLRKRRKTMGERPFQKEREILQKLSHPAVPALYAEINDGSHQYLVMEYKEGLTFEQLIFQFGKKYSEKDAFHYLTKILEVVQYIHDQNVVHRDLRIPNILLYNDSISIIDFGLSRLITDEEEESFHKWEPEKQRMRKISFQTDFYALGHFVLFLLYSSFDQKGKKEKSWEEELDISVESKNIIKKLFGMDGSYKSAEEILEDIQKNSEIGGE